MKRLVVLMIAMSSLLGVAKTNAQVAVGISVGIAPPAIPVYAQPPCPVEGYLWTPGYWYWGAAGYYWVPGVWVRPVRVGWLWTPGYWGWEGGHYWWHGGYWGEHVGYYGGINYGFGYGGSGFYGGRWEGGAFRYNTAVWRTGAGFHNTYVDRTVINNNVSRTSYNGPGGVTAQPSREEQSYMHEQHVQASSEQMNHQQTASANRNQFASNNGGNPRTAARSSVGGQRYNAAGNAMHSAPRSNGQQMQHGNMQSRSMAQPQRGGMQGRGMQGGAQRQNQGGGGRR
jgi:hypothetical protein